MTYQEIQEALATVARLSYALEEKYIESEGEVTEETEMMEEEMTALQTLLSGEGIDSLGRWLKSKEDEMKTYKDEKAAADRRIKSVQNTIDFVKAKITEVMAATGQQKAKGMFYSFTATTSEKSSVNQEALDAEWKARVETAARVGCGLPDYIEVILKTTTTALKEAGVQDFLETTTKDTVRFTKPRKAE